METKNFLKDYNTLKQCPVSLGEIFSTYGISVQPALLSKFIISEKILPVLTEKNDLNLSASTLVYMIDSAKEVKPDTVFFPLIGKDECVSLAKVVVAQMSGGTAPEYMRDLINHIDAAAKELSIASNDPKMRTFQADCIEAFNAMRDYFRENLMGAIGYALAIRTDGSEVTIGNAMMTAMADGMNIGAEDLRPLVFSNVFSGYATVSNTTMETIDMVISATGKAIGVAQESVEGDILEGAEISHKGAREGVLNYLAEVRCAANNVHELVKLCEKTNYDMECALFESITSEDCVADISTSSFGWADPSILNRDAEAISTNIDNIFSMDYMSGKNMQYVLGAAISCDNDEERKAITEKLKNTIIETLKWEGAHENYTDLPVAHYLDVNMHMLETLTQNTMYAPRLREIHETLTEGLKKAMEEECVPVPSVFNPCPTLNSITPFPVACRASQLAFDEICKAETDDEMDNAMLGFAKFFPSMESNAVSKGARDVSRKVQKGSEKAIRGIGGTAHEIKQAAHNAIDPMEKYIGQMMEKLRKEDAAKRREIIVKGGVMPKVLRWVKRSIGLITGAAIGAHVLPAAAVASGIALIGFIASDKYLDAKEKRKILREIEDEIEIVNEKIDDARSDSNKQKRYELIRIRNDLKRTQDRIVYNLKE